MPASVELRVDDDGSIVCEHGVINESWADSSHLGVITGMGPLMVFANPPQREVDNLGAFGIKITITGDVARTVATNGEWVHRLEPAHWRGGVPPEGYVTDILLGRWPD